MVEVFLIPTAWFLFLGARIVLSGRMLQLPVLISEALLLAVRLECQTSVSEGSLMIFASEPGLSQAFQALVVVWVGIHCGAWAARTAGVIYSTNPV